MIQNSFLKILAIPYSNLGILNLAGYRVSNHNPQLPGSQATKGKLARLAD